MITDQQAQANKERMQLEGMQAWCNNHYRGTLAWATGVGKSRAAILCIEHLHRAFSVTGNGIPKGLLIVPTEEMRDTDWPDEFQKWDCSMDNITTICYASLHKEVLTDYDYFIYDECHRTTLANLQKLYHYKGPVLGLTATFPDSIWEEDLERVALITELMPPVHTITTDEAVDLGLISDFEVHILQFYLDAATRNIKGGSKKKPKIHSEKAEYTRLTRIMQLAAMKKNEGMKFAALTKRMLLIANLPSKIRMAKAVLAKMAKEPRRTLVFCASIDQADQLCGKDVFHSRSDSSALDRFQAGELNLMACVKALNEGKNLYNVQQELIVQVDSQERNLVQRIGRSLRRVPGRPLDYKIKIVILVALNTADEKWFKSSIKAFRTKRLTRHLARVPDVEKSWPETAGITA